MTALADPSTDFASGYLIAWTFLALGAIHVGTYFGVGPTNNFDPLQIINSNQQGSNNNSKPTTKRVPLVALSGKGYRAFNPIFFYHTYLVSLVFLATPAILLKAALIYLRAACLSPEHKPQLNVEDKRKSSLRSLQGLTPLTP
eukprot:3061169-Amphidinium_carterae.1